MDVQDIQDLMILCFNKNIILYILYIHVNNAGGP